MLVVAFGLALLIGALAATAVALAYTWMMPVPLAGPGMTALTLPLVTSGGLAVALLGVVVLLAAWWSGQRTPFSKGCIAVGLAGVAVLAVLFPLADSGRLSLVP